MKIKLGVFFGGKSVEHEVSVITALQAIENIDKDKYDVIPIYISKENEMFVGNDIGNIEKYKNIEELISKSIKVIITQKNGKGIIVKEKNNIFEKKEYDYFDIAFPIVHGTNLEGGALYGFFKILNIPCVGCDVLSSAVSMNKYVTKCVLKCNDIPVLDSLFFDLGEEYEKIADNVENNIEYPVIVKPVDSGSSVGIAIAKNRDELLENIESAFMYAQRIIVEKAISKFREINCSVLGDYEECIASECEEPIKTDEILSYKDKYISGGSKIKGVKLSGIKIGENKNMNSGSIIPANIDEKIKIKIQDISKKVFKTIKCSGVIRIDFIIDESEDKIYVNEVNTIPGCLSFHLWKKSNISYKELLDRIIEASLKRKIEENNIRYSFESNILNESFINGSKGIKI